jgi:hypothetical protein
MVPELTGSSSSSNQQLADTVVTLDVGALSLFTTADRMIRTAYCDQTVLLLKYCSRNEPEFLDAI